MATKSINPRDVLKVTRLVREQVGPLRAVGGDLQETGDGVRFLISGWSHSAGWSRGFMVTGSKETGGHISPIYDHDARWEGRGWHARMASDIVKRIGQLRERR